MYSITEYYLFCNMIPQAHAQETETAALSRSVVTSWMGGPLARLPHQPSCNQPPLLKMWSCITSYPFQPLAIQKLILFSKCNVTVLRAAIDVGFAQKLLTARFNQHMLRALKY